MQLRKKILILAIIFLLMIVSLLIGMRSNHRPTGSAREANNLKIETIR